MTALHGIEAKAVTGFQLVSLDVPEKYEKGTGIAVDLRHIFSKEILDAWVMRGVWKGLLFEITEEDNDRFLERRFILRVKYPTASILPKGENSLAKFIGEESQTKGEGAGTPEGSISPATFKGGCMETTKDSAGIPQGSVSAPEFIGDSSQTLEAAIGIPQGTVSTPEFKGEPLGTHTHMFHGEQPEEYPVGSAEYQIYRVIPQSPKGKNSAELSGTPRGKVSQPSFEGKDMGSHSHAVPAVTGKVSTPEFKGSELPPHSHEVNLEGSISSQTFTGSPLSPHKHTFLCKGKVTGTEFSGELISPQTAVEIEDGFELRKMLGRRITLGVIGI